MAYQKGMCRCNSKISRSLIKGEFGICHIKNDSSIRVLYNFYKSDQNKWVK